MQQVVGELALRVGERPREGRGVGDRHPDRHHVDQQAHGVGELLAASLVHRHPDDQFALPGVRGQGRRVGGQQRGGEEDAPRGRQLPDPRDESGGHPADVGGAREAVRHLPVRAVGGQVQDGQRPGEPLAPVRQQLVTALGEQASLLLHEAVEGDTAPAGVRGGRTPPCHQCLVRLEERAHHQRGRAAVEDGVVCGDQHDRLGPRAVEDPHPEEAPRVGRRAGVEDERALALAPHDLQCLGVVGDVRQVHAVEVRLPGGVDRLARGAPPGGSPCRAPDGVPPAPGRPPGRATRPGR